MRRIECKVYPECLERVAKENRKGFDCDGCEEYVLEDPVEKWETAGKPEKEETMGEIRVCATCGEGKPIEDFNKGSGKDGRKSKCRQCEADYYQEYKVRKAEGKVRPRKGALRKRAVKNAKKAIEEAKAKTVHTSEDVYKTGTTDRFRQVHAAVAPQLNRARELAEEHWEYVRGLLTAHGDDGEPDVLNQIEFHYKSAMIHGYKHGVQDAAGVN